MKRVVCFDLWNTLITSLDPTGASYEKTLVQAGVVQAEIYPLVRDQLMNADWSYKKMTSIITNHFEINDPEVAKQVVTSWQQDNTQTTWFPGATRLLKELGKTNILVLISNITAPGWKTVNAQLNIERYFDMVILSFAERISKPDEKLWLKVEESHPDATEYWMIGDNESDDLTVPQNRDWKTILVSKNGTDLIKIRSQLTEGTS